MSNAHSQDVARTTLQLLALGALILGSFWILWPFLAAGTWATTIVVAGWPLLLRIQRWLGGRRSLAVAAMTIALLLLLVVPLYLAIDTIVGNAQQIAESAARLTTLVAGKPPGWVEGLPLVGATVAERWHELASAGPEGLAAHLAPVARSLVLWFVSQVGSIGLLLVHFLLTVIIAAILFANGEAAARGADRFARRLAGPRGENLLHLAAQAVRAVALGVVVTALLQAAFSWIGFVVAGVPFAPILTAMIFVLAVAQVGAVPVLLGAVVWVYTVRGAAWGIGFLVWAIFCGTFDNFLRPMLIRHGADLPLLLIFAGVIGGLVAFGVVGLFIGPVVLAVAYTLLADWVSETPPEAPPPAVDAG